VHASRIENRRSVLPDKTGSQIGRTLKRLRLHGLIKKIAKTCKYYLAGGVLLWRSLRCSPDGVSSGSPEKADRR
jgi:hypothetical protein